MHCFYYSITVVLFSIHYKASILNVHLFLWDSWINNLETVCYHKISDIIITVLVNYLFMPKAWKEMEKHQNILSINMHSNKCKGITKIRRRKKQTLRFHFTQQEKTKLFLIFYTYSVVIYNKLATVKRRMLWKIFFRYMDSI